MSRRIRISAGPLGGRLVSVPPGVRPTAGRVRESLMSIWTPSLVGARFLDLFAGSGAVGIEALSRGAARVVFVDSDPQVVEHLNLNCRVLDLKSVRILRLSLPEDAARLSAKITAAFNLIFADPPYAFDRYSDLLRFADAWLAPTGQLAIEHEARHQLPADTDTLWRVDQRRYGDSHISIFAWKSPPRQDGRKNASSSR